MRNIVFSPEARDDLFKLYRYIIEHGAPNAALAYVARLETRCAISRAFPNRDRDVTTSDQA